MYANLGQNYYVRIQCDRSFLLSSVAMSTPCFSLEKSSLIKLFSLNHYRSLLRYAPYRNNTLRKVLVGGHSSDKAGEVP